MSESYEIGLLTEQERPAFVALVNEAFDQALRHMFGKLPPGRREGDRLAQRFYRPGCRILVIRDAEGVVRAGLHLQDAGTRSLAGPLAVAQSYQLPWKRGVAQALVERLCAVARERGGGVIDSVTFPHSTKHFMAYYPYGEPVRQAPFFEKRARRRALTAFDGLHVERFGAASPEARARLLEGAFAVTDSVWPGYDRRADVEHVAARGLGETLFATRGAQVVGFVVCHYGPGSEAFADDQMLLKCAYVAPRDPALARAGERPDQEAFVALLEAAEELALAEGSRSLGAMVSSGCRDAVLALGELGFQPTQMHEQWIHCPDVRDEASIARAMEAFRPHVFALSEWR